MKPSGFLQIDDPSAQVCELEVNLCQVDAVRILNAVALAFILDAGTVDSGLLIALEAALFFSWRESSAGHRVGSV